MTHGGKRKGAGRPPTERGTGSPQTVIRWSALEHEIMTRAVGGDPRDIAKWARPILVRAARLLLKQPKEKR